MQNLLLSEFPLSYFSFKKNATDGVTLIQVAGFNFATLLKLSYQLVLGTPTNDCF